jgi:hypothetical protein
MNTALNSITVETVNIYIIWKQTLHAHKNSRQTSFKNARDQKWSKLGTSCVVIYNGKYVGYRAWHKGLCLQFPDWLIVVECMPNLKQQLFNDQVIYMYVYFVDITVGQISFKIHF